MASARPGRAIQAGLALLMVSGCSVPVAGNLDELDANQAVRVLAENAVSAEKERDPEHEGHYRISVLKDDAPSAISALARENLPPRVSPGVLEALGAGGMVPSRLAEQARWTAGIAGDLERSLRSLDGVLSARVHLAMPLRETLDAAENAVAPSASVLLRHRGATPPLVASEIQRLVAGAVPGLAAEQVSVVMTPSASTRAAEPPLTRFGPLSVSRGSGAALRVAAAVVIALNLSLLGVVFALFTRLRRAEQRLGDAKSEAELSPAHK